MEKDRENKKVVEKNRNGFFLEKLESQQKSLALVAAMNQILNQSLHSLDARSNSNFNNDLPLLLKNCLNFLAKEMHLPFLLLSIQDSHRNEAIIAESSIIHPEERAGQQNASSQAGQGAQGTEAGQRKTKNINYRHSYRSGEGIIGMVVESKRAYFCPDIHSAPEFLNRTGLKEQFSGTPLGYLCLPIARDKQVIGTLSTGLFYQNELGPNPNLGPRQAQPSDFSSEDFLSQSSLPQGFLSGYKLDNPVFPEIGELGYFLQIVCDQLARVVEMRIELEQERERLERVNAILRSRASENESLQKIVGSSSAMQELFMQVTQVAKVDTTVLIRGESGTGKELVARAIHLGSSRAEKPFISVNCATLPEGLIDSELFGHAKGAFTGALQNYKGRFELAEGGTLFLDEISELPHQLQSKLLRVLQEKEYKPLGSELSRHADVRIIAASNHNLERDIEERRFREDLFFRLSVFPIHLPPLRERKSDITALVDHFLEKNTLRLGTGVVRVADSAISLLMSYNWPGNVRELENVIERASILCEEGVIYAHHLPPTLQSAKSSETSINYSLKEAVERLELDMLYEALKDHNGNMRLAAQQLGITERQIGLRMKRYDLEYKNFRTP